MAKQLNIDLSFNADASKAKAQIMDLQKSLDQLISSTIKNNSQLGIDKEIKQAIDDTAKLKVALQSATDIDTGKLNLVKFSDSLKAGNMTLSQYAKSLSALGPEGEQSFSKIAKAIVSAQTPMRQTNTLLNQMFVTLKNTAKWQISSSVLHGLQSGLAGAFSYAKELDQSLNNIRIVTGYSNDEMAKFAESANKAAQALSTTTTSYTDAALIYYQQGIRDEEEIASRTETTIKLANVSRQSAEEVSSQMTAIWNNFDDGSKSLEYYADVITALGANTAASSEEIANGMSKFAAVAETVGLSYEYAASSLATIVATTRQSEDTVGTGLRTIFSRLEGLKLGETLEDGVDLNKYSAALATIGVNIKDANGQLKQMDTILNETAAQWDNLDKAQKVAFATTVGGVRQYTNLIALLDHWDMMQENVGIAKGSEGTLQEQADIYAQSWEAAQKRVRAAAEQIYDDLIDEKFFIKLGDFFTTALNGVDNFINAIGGIPGVIAGIGVVLTTVFGKQLSESINSAMYEFSRFTGQAKNIANQQRQDAIQATGEFFNTGEGVVSVQGSLLKQEIYDSYELQKITSSLTEEQLNFAKAALETSEHYHQIAIEADNAYKKATQEHNQSKGTLIGKLGSVNRNGEAVENRNAREIIKIGSNRANVLDQQIKEQIDLISGVSDKVKYQEYENSLKEVASAQEEVLKATEALNVKKNDEKSSTEEITAAQDKLTQATEKLTQARAKEKDLSDQIKNAFDLEPGAIDAIAVALERHYKALGLTKEEITAEIEAILKENQVLKDRNRTLDNSIKDTEDFKKKLSELKTGFQDIGTGAVTTLKGVSQLAMGITSIKGAMDALNNTELTFFEKFSRVLMGLSIGISQFASGLPVLSEGVTALGGSLAKVVPGLSGTGAAATIAAGGLSGVALAAGIVTVAIGVVTGVVLGLKAAWEHFTPEGKLAVAEKEAEKSKKAFEESKNAVTEFKATYDDWSSLYEKTKTLTKNTDEYREAILKADEAALELIKKYNLIKNQDWTVDENGHIIINSESKKNALDKDYYNNLITDNEAEIQVQQGNIDVAAKAASKTESAKHGQIIDYFGRYSDEYKQLAEHYLANGTEGLSQKYLELGLGTLGDTAGGYEKQLPEIIKLAEQIQKSQSIIDVLDRQNEVTQAKLSLGDNYKAELEPLLNQFVNKNIGVNGENSGTGIKSAQDIADAYNNALSSITSNDIDDSTKQQLAYALAEAQLKGSEIVDLSGIDTSNWTEEFIKKTFGENASKIQDAIDEAAAHINPEKITQNFETVNSIIKELGDGNSISAESYSKLTKAQQAYFKDMGDGTYQLIGEAKDFINALRGEALTNSISALEKLQQQENTVNRLSQNAIEGKGESYLWNKDVYQNDSGIAKQRVEALSAVGQDTTEWDTKLAEGNMTADDYAKLTEEVYKYKDAIIALATSGQDFGASQQTILNSLAAQATSLHELQGYMQSANGNYEAYSVGLMDLASQYDNCEQELKEYQEALESQDEAAVKAAQSALEQAIIIGEASKKYGLNAKTVETQARQLEKAYDMSADSAARLAVANERMNRGVATLNKNWSSWGKTLKSTDHTSQKYAEALNEATDALADLTGTADSASIPIDFLDSSTESGAKHLKWMEEAAQGNEKAINQLGVALGAASVEAMEFNEQMVNNAISSDLLDEAFDLTAFENYKAEVMEGINALADAVANGTVAAGENIAGLMDGTGESWVTSLNKMALATGMSVEQMNSLLNQLGVQAKVEVKNVPQEMQVPTYTEYSQAQQTDPGQKDEATGMWITPPTWSRKTWTVPGEPKTVKGYAQVAQISTEDGDIGSPQITYTGTAGSGRGGGVSTPSGKGGGGGRRGGGGGGGREFRKIDRTEKDEKQKKKVEDEIERYHKVKNELQDIEKELSLIGKAKDRAFGRNKIRQIDAETASLKKQSETQKKYLSEIQGWLEKDNAKAKEFGFEINGEGLVTNYEENMKKLIDKVNGDYDNYIAKLNALEDAYNAAGVDDEDSKKKLEDDKKALAKEWEANQKYYEDAKEALSKQEETHDLLIEQQEALQDMLNNIYDNGITKITYAVELKVDVADRDIALLQDLLEDIGDKADGACDAIANFGNQLEDTLDKVDTYTQSVSDILEHAGADEDLIDKILNNDFNEDDQEDVLNIGQDENGLNETEIEHLKSTADALLQTNKDLRELREQALQKTSEAFEEFNEQLDRGIAKIEHLTTVTQTYRDVLDIVGKDVLDRNGKLTDALNKQTYNIQRNHTHALQAQLDFIDTALDKAQALYDEAVENGYNQQTLESLKADVEKYEDERQATYEKWLDSWKQECQIAKDYYEDTLNQILSDFEDAVAGQFKNLSGLSEEFARKNEIADIYVEDYEKIYQLSKLNRDINKSLDDSTTLASKAKLRDIQKEINDLQESGVEVSQYDLDVLRKKYEMALAYEQWQDAQNAKTVVRMQRDNEGNYGYVYTADQSDVEAAEQNYEDKLHEMQVLNAEYIQSLQEQIIQAQQDCADALANLRAEDFASYEEYQDAVEQIRKDYTKRVETLSQQMGNAMDNNRTLYEQDWTAYSQATGYKISADEDYIDKFNETVYSQLTGFQTMEESQNAFVEAVNDASDLAAQNWEDWYVRTNTALDDAEMSMQNYADEVGDTVEQLGEEAEQAEEDVWNMSEEFSDAYSTISDTVGDFLDEYSNYIDSMIDANQALIDSINQVIRAYAELHGLEDDAGMMEPEEIDADWEEQWDAAGNLTGWKAKDKATGQYITGENKKVKWVGNDQIAGYTTFYNFDSSGLMQTNGRNEINTGFGGTTFTDEEKKKYYKIASGATGMYTGDWGDNSGKLAILHKKELVLNAEDTENILSAVDMIRSISSAIDLNALAASSAFASPNAAYKSSFGSRDSLEQNVHIQAEFPNVSDHNEIEEALNNLVERAAQFAGRKNL